MADFDLSTAQPAGFDLSTAQPAMRVKSYDAVKGQLVPTGSAEAKAAQSPVSDSGLQNFLAGAGKATVDLGRGIGQWGAGVMDAIAPRSQSLGGLVTGQSPVSRVDEWRQAVKDSRTRDAALMGTGAGKAGFLTGNIVDSLPAAWIPGAGTIAGSAAIGAGLGALQSSASGRETLSNIGIGGVTAPAALLAGRGVGALYQGAKGAIEPLFRGGQERIAARTLQSFAGGPQAAANAAETIANAAATLPGLQPTTAELANNAGLAQLERTLRNNPEALQALTARNQANRSAMTGALQGIAGTPEDLAIAQKARGALSNPLYSMAAEDSVTSSPQLERLMSRPSMQAAWQRAQQLAAERGEHLVAGQDIPEQLAIPSLGTQSAAPNSSRDSLLQFLAKHSKGLSSTEAEAQGIDPADMKSFAAHFGINRAFRKSGMSFDQAAETLHEAGYPVADEFGRYDPNVLLDKISDELGGKKVYSLNNPTMGMDLGQGAAKVKAPDVYSGKAIQYLKMGLNDIANTAEQKGMGAHEQAALNQTRSALNDYITKNIPMLKAADSAYASASRPINQMQIGQELSNKLIPALGEFGNNTRLTAGSYANALRNGDQLAARTTGLEGSTLQNTLNPDQMRTITQVGEQLARRANADELGRAVGSNTGQNLASQNVLRQFLGPLGLPQSMGERAAQSTLGQTVLKPLQWTASVGEPRILQRLADASLNPQEAQRLLRLAQSNPRVAQMLWARQGLLGASSQPIVSGLLGNSPQQ